MSVSISLFIAISDRPKLHQLDLFKQCLQEIKIIDRVAAEWKTVALRLQFEDHYIKNIEKDCHFQVVSACRTMFTQWLEGNGRKPTTWETLINALEKANLYTVAEDLRKIFFISSAESTQAAQCSFPPGLCYKREGLGI